MHYDPNSEISIPGGTNAVANTIQIQKCRFQGVLNLVAIRFKLRNIDFRGYLASLQYDSDSEMSIPGGTKSRHSSIQSEKS